jgi:pyruvate kinase
VPNSKRSLHRLIARLTDVRHRCLAMEHRFADAIERSAPAYRDSARNLLHYLGLRQGDLRDLQRELTAFGLSSLGRTEAHTLAGVDAVLAALHKLAGRKCASRRAPLHRWDSRPDLRYSPATRIGSLGLAPRSGPCASW